MRSNAPILRPPSESWLDHRGRVGSIRQWSRGAATLGALLGGLVPLSATLALGGGNSLLWSVLMLAPFHMASALVGGAAGLLAGLVEPALLDRLRGRIPLPMIALLQTIIGGLSGSAAGAAWGGALMLFVAEPALSVAGIFAGLGALVGAVAALVWWLPFTVAIVLGQPRLAGLVTSAVGFGLPSLIGLLLALMML